MARHVSFVAAKGILRLVAALLAQDDTTEKSGFGSCGFRQKVGEKDEGTRRWVSPALRRAVRVVERGTHIEIVHNWEPYPGGPDWV